MARLINVTRIHARPEQAERVWGEFEKLVPIIRAQAGCVRYALHQDNEDMARSLFFETSESRERWRRHMEAPSLAACLEATEGRSPSSLCMSSRTSPEHTKDPT